MVRDLYSPISATVEAATNALSKNCLIKGVVYKAEVEVEKVEIKDYVGMTSKHIQNTLAESQNIIPGGEICKVFRNISGV